MENIKMKYAVIIEKTRTGFGAYAPDVPGCGVTGKTLSQIKKRFRKALALHFQSLHKHRNAIPRPTTRAAYLEITAA
jgi:predicted RNase H-like HicB family nuclease